jgi:hypothetical protein
MQAGVTSWHAQLTRLSTGVESRIQQKKKARKTAVAERTIAGVTIEQLKQKREKKDEIVLAAKKASIAKAKERKAGKAAKSGAASGGAKKDAKAKPAAAKKEGAKAEKK